MGVYDVKIKSEGEIYNICIELNDLEYLSQDKKAIVEATTDVAMRYLNLKSFEILTFDNNVDINAKVCC